MSRRWDDVAVGDGIGTLAFPITVSRLVIAAGANRDFNAIHHNADFARATGAPDMYANSLFLQGMWERLVRAYIGPSGRIWSLGGFRMRSFNCPGDTVTVSGRVTEKWIDGERAMIRIELRSDNRAGLTVGPGFMTAELVRGGPSPRGGRRETGGRPGRERAVRPPSASGRRPRPDRPRRSSRRSPS